MPVVTHIPTAVDSRAVEPGSSTAEKADHYCLLLISENLDISQPPGVINREMNLVVANAVGASFLPVSRDPMPPFAEAGQLFDTDMDQITRMFPLVAE